MKSDTLTRTLSVDQPRHSGAGMTRPSLHVRTVVLIADVVRVRVVVAARLPSCLVVRAGAAANKPAVGLPIRWSGRAPRTSAVGFAQYLPPEHAKRVHRPLLGLDVSMGADPSD